MATVYKIEIQTVSEFNNYSPEHLREIIKEILEDKAGLNLVNTTTKVIER